MIHPPRSGSLFLLFATLLTAAANQHHHNNFVLLDSDLTQKRIIWMSGMQLEGSGTGVQAEYIANSSTYLDAYLVALESAMTNAPSLVPILVVQGHIDADVVDDLQAMGALVVQHTLSFRDKLEKYTPELITGLWGSYLRIDVPNIMPKIERLVDRASVDTNYVLWTDPDVIFLQDVNSSVLPKPRYLSIGPDASPDLAENGGVIYYNVTAYREVFGDLMQWSEKRHFDFKWVDQSMLVGYFNQGGVHRITPLPNVFNWCGEDCKICARVCIVSPTGSHTGAVQATTSDTTACPTSLSCIFMGPSSKWPTASFLSSSHTTWGAMRPRGGSWTASTRRRWCASVGAAANTCPATCCSTCWATRMQWTRGSTSCRPRSAWPHLRRARLPR